MIASILVEAALLIAYDNGMINRHMTEAYFLNATISLLGSFSVEELRSVSAELTTLKELGKLEEVCCGEGHGIMVTTLTDRLLNSIFYGEIQ
jgi:hypothetical protein